LIYLINQISYNFKDAGVAVRQKRIKKREGIIKAGGPTW
jgi:hypothetical protein